MAAASTHAAGLRKPTKYRLEDTNIANLGTELEKNVRLAAAQGEPAWEGVGKKAGLRIWRIEKFKVVAVPDAAYGNFFDGDSYIVLKTVEHKPGVFSYDIYFWLGLETTQDEAGTAAYKTVELDDYLGTLPVQHREVQGAESDAFVGLFAAGKLKVLHGGIDSGFHHVKPEEWVPRLLHVKQLAHQKTIRVAEVPRNRDSLNSGDVFLLDAGLQLYQWNGSKSSGAERSKAGQLARALDEERAGKPTVTVFSEGDKDAAPFWKHIEGGEGAVKSAADGDAAVAAAFTSERVLNKLSDASGKLTFTEVARGAAVKRSLVTGADVFVYDAGANIFVWVGKGASAAERRNALGSAMQYLTQANRPAQLPITRILEGGENEYFEAAF